MAAVGSGLLEFFGGLAILVGFQTRIVAIVLAIFTLAATAVAHLNFADQMQMLMLQKNLGLTGGFLLLAVLGAGAYSVDARRGLNNTFKYLKQRRRGIFRAAFSLSMHRPTRLDPPGGICDRIADRIKASR